MQPSNKSCYMYKGTFAEVICGEDGEHWGTNAFLYVVDTVLCMDKMMASSL